MTPSQYILTSLEELKKPSTPEVVQSDKLADEIYRLLLSKKFRKYAADPQLQTRIKNAIKLNIEKQQPINLTFVHGAYKLWRLEDSPHAGWAELFAAMYYTKWLKPICEIYKPGVWFDFYVDDLVVPLLNNIELSAIESYVKSFQEVLNFLKSYQPENMRMTITRVGDQFDSPEAFHKKLQADVKKYAEQFPNGLPTLNEKQIAMIELNVKQTPDFIKDPQWKEKNTLLHDAYIMLTKKGAGYHLQPTKVIAFTQPIPGIALAVGSTKTSIAKFWVGVGVLQKRKDSYLPIVLTPNQYEQAMKQKYTTEKVNILDLPNFSEILIFDKPFTFSKH